MKEEQLKINLQNVLVHFNQNEKMSIGSIYYVLKDLFRDYEKAYSEYLEQQMRRPAEDPQLTPLQKEVKEENDSKHD